MKTNRNNRRRIAAAAVLAIGLSAAGYGFTAANTVPDTIAGDGVGDISGVEVSDVHYNLNENDPQSIDSVEFTLDEAPASGGTVKINLQDTTGTWHDCELDGLNAECETADETVLDAEDLRVVVAD
jgi:hypothetical protein